MAINTTDSALVSDVPVFSVPEPRVTQRHRALHAISDFFTKIGCCGLDEKSAEASSEGQAPSYMLMDDFELESPSDFLCEEGEFSVPRTGIISRLAATIVFCGEEENIAPVMGEVHAVSSSARVSNLSLQESVIRGGEEENIAPIMGEIVQSVRTYGIVSHLPRRGVNRHTVESAATFAVISDPIRSTANMQTFRKRVRNSLKPQQSFWSGFKSIQYRQY